MSGEYVPERDQEEEIEITQEMIDAGAQVLEDQCDLLRASASSIARVVFQEMIRRRR